MRAGPDPGGWSRVRTPGVGPGSGPRGLVPGPDPGVGPGSGPQGLDRLLTKIHYNTAQYSMQTHIFLQIWGWGVFAQWLLRCMLLFNYINPKSQEDM